MREITDLDELKNIELEVMKKLHNFCEENNIKYVLSFGTLIGAVRHKGFIPWDDDIDIFMERNDYEKFLKLFPNKNQELGLKMANHMTPIYYGRVLTKVFDINTVLTEPQYKSDDPIGVFVDVWPLDGLPNNKIKRRLVLLQALILKKMLLSSSMKNDSSYSFLKKAAITIGNLFDSKQLVHKLDALAKKHNNKDSEYLFCYAGQDAVYHRKSFEKVILSEFEDTSFYIPVKYDEILTAEFGDYMQLPPENERVPHHVLNTYYK